MTKGRDLHALAAALLVLAALSWALPAGAQGRVLLRGRVVDDITQAPLEGAIVMQVGDHRGYMTDSLGLFALPVYPEPQGYRLSVEQLGYNVIEVDLGPSAPEDFVIIKLPVNPIRLEGLNVLVDRFARRRSFFSGSVRVVDQRRLMTSAGTAYDIVRRVVPFSRMCAGSLDNLCSYRRGTQVTISVCIDEAAAMGGASELDLYDPSELYLLEVFDGMQVRVYTRAFVERAMREGRRLHPLSWGCT